MAKEKEIWKDIAGYESLYQVSNLGRVKSFDRVINSPWRGRKDISYIKKGRIRKISMDRKGYPVITLDGYNKNRKTYKVHRLVAEAFIPNPENKPQINHIDGNKENNRVWNLEWCDNSYNQIHAYANGLNTPKRGSKNGNSKLTKEEVLKIRELGKSDMTQQEISELFNVSRPHIGYILRNEIWNHI